MSSAAARLAPDVAIGRRSFRQVRTTAIVWTLVFGTTVAASALTYASAYPDAASRHRVALATNTSRGLAVLLGPVAEIETVGGYTVYKCFVFLTSIGAIWGLLAATKLLRGEEDSGRWQVVLAGATRAPRATAATLGALGAAVAVVFAGTTAITALAGRDPDLGFGVGATILYGAGLASAPAVFAAVGAVTSQLARSRRLATGIGMAAFALCFAVRMIADSGPSTRWLLWATPFGWIERTRPYTHPDWRPLGLALVAVAVLVVTATRLAGRRDAGGGVFAAPDSAAVRPFGLGSPFGLLVRREGPVLAAWLVGASVGAFAFGIVAKVASSALPSSTDILEHFGVRGTLVRQYFGVAFLLIATIVCLLPASQIGAALEEEVTGRTAILLAQPTLRTTLLAGQLALTGGAAVAVGVATGLLAWLGAWSQGVDAGFGRMLQAGLNVTPSALLVLGLGAVVLSLAPRAAAPTVYAVVLGSLVVDLLSSLVGSTRWLEHLSLFHYMALAPAQPVDSRTVAVTLALAAALLVAAVRLAGRRDLSHG